MDTPKPTAGTCGAVYVVLTLKDHLLVGAATSREAAKLLAFDAGLSQGAVSILDTPLVTDTTFWEYVRRSL